MLTIRLFQLDDIEDAKEVRILIVGKTGAGKSATGNTILGKKYFKTAPGGSSVTRVGRIGIMKWKTMIINVIDTPGFLDTETTKEKVHVEIIKSCGMASPGPHVILYVISARNRFTSEDQQAVEELAKLLSGDPYKHMIICFTEKDAIERDGMSPAVFLLNITSPLRTLLDQCGNRTVFFNNVSEKTKSQWMNLCSVIKEMLEINGDSFYSNEILRETEAALLKKMKEESDPSKAKRWLYAARRNIANDGSIVSYLKTTIMGTGACGPLSAAGAFLVILAGGHGVLPAVAAAKTATLLGGAIGGSSFFTGKAFVRICSIS